MIDQNDPPQSTQGDRSIPFAAAVAHFQQLAGAEADIVSAAGGSLLLAHGESTARAYVLLHGTTNSPAQLQAYGRYLFDRGHNVFIPRMPYHGLRSGQVSELARLTTDDLRAFARDTAAVGGGLGDDLVLIGASGGAAVAAWTAVMLPRVTRTLLLVPFFGFRHLPAGLTGRAAQILLRLPDRTLHRPGEKHRPWAYPGQSTRGIAAYLVLANEIMAAAEKGAAPQGEIIVITTASDNLVNNGTTSRLVALWRDAGTIVEQFEFERVEAVPHDTVDPAADPRVRQLVFQKMLALLGEADSRHEGPATEI